MSNSIEGGYLPSKFLKSICDRKELAYPMIFFDCLKKNIVIKMMCLLFLDAV